MTETKRGGPGRGQGRKAQYSELVRGHTIHMTDAQWSMLVELGGGQAVRDWIDKQARKKARTTNKAG